MSATGTDRNIFFFLRFYLNRGHGCSAHSILKCQYWHLKSYPLDIAERCLEETSFMDCGILDISEVCKCNHSNCNWGKMWAHS